MAEIRVPKVPMKAFNKSRPASDLLRHQVAQLQHVAERMSGAGAMKAEANKVKTEGQAAAFIAKMIQRIHPEGATSAAAPSVASAAPPVVVSARPRARAVAAATPRKKTPKRRSAR